jgi:hypothetical protein
VNDSSLEVALLEVVINPELQDEIVVTVIATGFDDKPTSHGRKSGSTGSLTLSVACAFDEFEVNDSSLEVALLEVFTLVPNPSHGRKSGSTGFGTSVNTSSNATSKDESFTSNSSNLSSLFLMKLGISSSLVVCVLSLTLSVACAFDEFVATGFDDKPTSHGRKSGSTGFGTSVNTSSNATSKDESFTSNFCHQNQLQ